MQNNIFRKVLVVGIIILFIKMSSIPSTGISKLEKTTIPILYDGNILYVGGDGPGNYSDIQDAVKNASNGDTVYVYNGTYYEQVKIGKSINLIGEDKNTTIIDACGSGNVVLLKTDYITVSGFTIQNGGKDGIHLFWSDKCLITNNIIINNKDCGIYSDADCWDCNITYNRVENNGVGIGSLVRGYLIFRNIVKNNDIGILLSGTEANVYKNIIANNDIGIFSSTVGGCNVMYNNLLDNDIHVSFEYFYPLSLLPLFFILHLLNKWKDNYYEGHRFGPKIIRGTLILYTITFELQFEINWVNFDWHPAEEPYDI